MSSAIQTCQPPRRSRAASTKSWLMISPPSGARPGQQRQAAELGERRDADDRVVAPVVAFAQRPVADPGGRQRAVELARELQHAREHGVAADELGRRLDQADLGIGVHPLDQAHHRAARHQAVGIEDDHVAVGAAPAGDEILDIADLAPQVAQPPTIVDPLRARHGLAQALPGLELGQPDIGVGRVAEDDQVDPVAAAVAPRRSSHIARKPAKTRSVSSL